MRLFCVRKKIYCIFVLWEDILYIIYIRLRLLGAMTSCGENVLLAQDVAPAEFGKDTMKKLLILGGSHYVIPVIEKAHELGVYVITCDYLPEAAIERREFLRS